MPQRFVESVNIDSKLIRKVDEKELQEKLSHASTSLKESVSNGKYPTTGWEVPISKYDNKNANGRIYPKSLWEKVLKEQKNIWEGAPMLADHPEGDSSGSPQNICGVWIGARLGEDGYVYGTVVPSGRLGEDFADHLSKGLRAGTSSSGFGDLEEDGETVDPSTYMIERLSDWVLTPSQGTYFTYETTTQEAKNASDADRFGESSNNKKTSIKENTTVEKLTKLEEKKFRRDMVSFLEDASKIDDPQEQLQEYEEILTYLENGAVPDLREQVTQKINDKKKEIKEMISNNKKMEETLGVKDVKDLTQKLTVIAEDTEILKKESADWKSVAQRLQKKLVEMQKELTARPSTSYVNHLKSKINKIQEANNSLKKKNALQEKEKANLKKTIVSVRREKRQRENKAVSSIQGQRSILEDKVAEIHSLEKKLAKERELRMEEKTKLLNYKKKIREESKPKIAPSPTEAMKKYVNFRETDDVENYWADLCIRHGASIKKFEDKIRSSKTVREAMAVYMKILPMMEDTQEIESTKMPEATPVETRAKILEKAGATIQVPSMYDRMPKGWN